MLADNSTATACKEFLTLTMRATLLQHLAALAGQRNEAANTIHYGMRNCQLTNWSTTARKSSSCKPRLFVELKKTLGPKFSSMSRAFAACHFVARSRNAQLNICFKSDGETF